MTEIFSVKIGVFGFSSNAVVSSTSGVFEMTPCSSDELPISISVSMKFPKEPSVRSKDKIKNVRRPETKRGGFKTF